MGRLIARNRYLFDGDRKFYARGVSYGTFAPNSRGEPFPEPERVGADFGLMRELGANVVRTYEQPPPWLMDAAAASGLRVMVGIPWASHLAFLDSRDLKREIRKTIANAVTAMAPYRDAVFAYTLGNEIRSDIVRWHGPRAIGRFLAELCDLGKQIDPEGLFTYANYPSTEYLDLGFLDFLSFNVYLHREDDFRRYLTHLMPLGEMPLVLSETGIDTIREGEEQQANFLAGQSRAAFELGLSGLVVFSFTDEWYRGGADITDWAFGIMTRERRPKPAFNIVAEIFKNELPPPLKRAPKASVVVAACNAELTLDGCLKSLAQLDYPDYETIVVDDGSIDATAEIARRGGVRVIAREHRGLAAARNAGIDAARGEVVAFIDADARADRDWLYHLVETVVRRQTAAGGPNFPPDSESAIGAAIAAAPGPPREVPSGDDSLAQLCGCNMAAEKSLLKRLGGFDPMFAAAGDDVDFSWRSRDSGVTLASAPGAIVTHDRRPTIGAYLAQQRGYGAAEGLLFRRYPRRVGAGEGVYGTGSLLSALFGGGRIYYGAFGRGLFQSVYPAAGAHALLEVPLSIRWIVSGATLIAAGAASTALCEIGCIAIAISLACAVAAAMTAPLDRRQSALRVRAMLFALCILGPLLRSAARESVKFQFKPRLKGTATAARRLRRRGAVRVAMAASNGAMPARMKVLLEDLRTSFFRRGVAAAVTDGFEPYDLQLLIAPALRVPINAVDEGGGRVSIRWRLALAQWPLLGSFGVLAILLRIAAAPLQIGALAVAIVAAATIATAAWRAALIPDVINACIHDAAQAAGLGVLVEDGAASQ